MPIPLAHYRIDGPPLLAPSTAYRRKIIAARAELAEYVRTIPGATGEYRTGPITGRLRAISFPKDADPPDGFIRPLTGWTYPSKESPTDVAVRFASHRIPAGLPPFLAYLGVPDWLIVHTGPERKIRRRSVWLGSSAGRAGIRWKSANGPIAIWIPDIPAIQATIRQAERTATFPDQFAWSMDETGLTRLAI